MTPADLRRTAEILRREVKDLRERRTVFEFAEWESSEQAVAQVNAMFAEMLDLAAKLEAEAGNP
jgi:hypothetical protein